ncbi:MAG: hydantoinase/oxoprolinase family protein [Methanobacterium sp.]|uniref:hydantoinase/oxoprolinase family protein n=1 Tax=Methanobacterium sp. TaxID=2164 RepID=UPI003C768B56
MKIAGFDIGGANTDVAVVDFDESGNIIGVETDFVYLPMWMKNDELSDALIKLLGNDIDEIDGVGVSMTAELVDAYKTKKDGVIDISNKSADSFNVPVGFVGLEGIMELSQVVDNPMMVAAANWIATAPLAAKMDQNCILIDIGSTTTDIIPIKNGEECALGRSDLERLKTGELVYSGTLRTNVVALTDKLPLDGAMLRIASELFAVTADIQMILGNITEEEYSCDTMDGSGKSVEDCMRRLSRVVCGDMDVLNQHNIMTMAMYIYSEQVSKISKALLEVSNRNNISKVITTGLGMDILGAKACEQAGLEYTGMDKILKKEDCVVAPAVGTAILMEQFIRNK